MTLLPFFLPPGFEPVVKEDDKIKEGDVLAENKNAAEASINISKDLGIPIRKVRNALKKSPGDVIVVGDVLAEKKGLMGGSVIKSTIEGTFVRLDEETGSLIMSGKDSKGGEKILSPVDGVVSMCNNEKILLKTQAEAMPLEEASGENFVGEVLRLKSADARDLDLSVSGKVVVAQRIERDGLAKAIGLGAGAVLAEELSDSEFENLRQRDTKTPVGRVKDSEGFLKNDTKVMVDCQKKIVIKL